MKVVIKQKMSNTGTIHDLASDMYDRVIDFGNRFNYAVILPSYYGDRFTRHEKFTGVMRQYKKWKDFGGVTVIDKNGIVFGEIYGRFEKTSDKIK